MAEPHVWRAHVHCLLGHPDLQPHRTAQQVSVPAAGGAAAKPLLRLPGAPLRSARIAAWLLTRPSDLEVAVTLLNNHWRTADKGCIQLGGWAEVNNPKP